MRRLPAGNRGLPAVTVPNFRNLAVTVRVRFESHGYGSGRVPNFRCRGSTVPMVFLFFYFIPLPFTNETKNRSSVPKTGGKGAQGTAFLLFFAEKCPFRLKIAF